MFHVHLYNSNQITSDILRNDDCTPFFPHDYINVSKFGKQGDHASVPRCSTLRSMICELYTVHFSFPFFVSPILPLLGIYFYRHEKTYFFPLKENLS